MDFIIRDAQVFDGLGTPGGGVTDVAVADGRIAAIGPGLVANGAEVIDARGLALMPGIIDTHTHYDAQITWDSGLNPSPALGVTTVVIGNCGFTIAPCRAADRNLTMRNLTQVEGMSIDVLRSGIVWDFETFADYLNAIEMRGTTPNVAAFLGHSSIRTYVMGAAAAERPATDDELVEMRTIVVDGMAAGAIGFSTSTAPQHNGADGIPMPSRLADDIELQTLFSAMGADGRGIFMLTKGDRTDVPYLEALAAEAGRPMMIAALLHNSTAPDNTFKDLLQISEARARGHELWGQVSCCPLTNDFTLESAYPLEGFTAWKPAMQVRGEELKRLYMNSDFRQSVKDELARPAGVRLFNGEWHKIELIEAAKPENQALEGKTVDFLSAEAGVDQLDWMLDFAVSEDLESVFTAVLLNADEDAVGQIIRDPNASVALSDAGAHLTFFCDAGFGLHLLGHWSRDLGVLSLSDAVRELTSKPAEIFRIPERGRIAPGYHADLFLFDPATVARGQKKRVFDLPGRSPRLTTDGIGVHGVWVNGTQIVDEEGVIDGVGNPGSVLRRFNG